MLSCNRLCYLLFAILISLAACGGDEATQEPQTDDAADPADIEPSDDPSNPVDETDPSSEPDPSDNPEPEPTGTDCATYLDCIDDCWLNTDDPPDSCFEACDDNALPEALEAADAYYECLDTCEEDNNDSDALEACYDETCGPLYNACIAPPECIAGCDHYDDICGDEGPLNRNETYWAGGTQHNIRPWTTQLLIRFKNGVRHTPDLPGVTRIETYPDFMIKNLAVVHLKSGTNRDNLAGDPAVAKIFDVYQSARHHRLLATDQVIAHIPNQTPTQLAGLLTNSKMRLIRNVKGLESTWLLQTESGTCVDAANRLHALPEVQWASPNFHRQYALRYTPNDPYFTDQWHLSNTGATNRSLAGADMRATFAWDQTRGIPDVRIAINDDGVDTRHDDLPFARNEDDSIVSVNGPNDMLDELNMGCCEHGTSVAGVAAAIGNNGVGTTGVCPECTIIPVWEDYSSPNEDVAVAETFTESIENGAWIINNSWGPPDGNPAVIESPAPIEPIADVINQAIEAAHTEARDGKGAVILFAAGNGNEDVASDAFVTHPLTIGVAAVNAHGIKSSYSDFGDSVWVSAPSDGNHLMPGIVTSDATGEFGYDRPSGASIDPSGNTTSTFGGTSSATPAVAGVVGLLFSINPELTANQVKDILRRTSRKIDMAHGYYLADEDGFLKSPFYGYGLVDAHAAVRAASFGCSADSDDVCIPLLDCSSGPQDTVTEICNGIDDNCDGNVGEDVCPEATATNEACDLQGGCAERCTWLKNDPVPACLASCNAEGACDEGFACRGELCVPDSGRLSPATEELCDGFDNDLNGIVDDGVCESSTDATCSFSAECDSSNGETVCVEGFCAPVCITTDDCESGVECQSLATQYGATDETSICAPSLDTGLTCIEACMFLEENAPGPIFQSIINCITEAPTCEDAIDCVPL